jgi:hypothetical protein
LDPAVAAVVVATGVAVGVAAADAGGGGRPTSGGGGRVGVANPEDRPEVGRARPGSSLGFLRGGRGCTLMASVSSKTGADGGECLGSVTEGEDVGS